MSANNNKGASPNKKQKGPDIKKLTLTYFSGNAGRAFGIRAALRHAGLRFEYIVADSDFKALKVDPQKLPLSALPTLQVEGKDGSSTIFGKWNLLSECTGCAANA